MGMDGLGERGLFKSHPPWQKAPFPSAFLDKTASPGYDCTVKPE
jgi:hypothetical protein